MKKTTWVLIAVAVVAVVVGAYLLNGGSIPTGSQPSSSGSSAPSSDSSSASSSGSSEPAPSSQQESSAAQLTDAQITEKIRAEIPLDWKKYALKEQKENPVSAGGKTYRTYAAWDEDYEEGPLILFNPDDGKLYTYANGDSAPVLAADDAAFDKTVRTVTGVVTDGAMMSIQIRTPEGNQLTVRRLGVELVNLDDGFKVGNQVKVTYTGTYQGDNSQRMFVQKIEGIKQ